MNDILGTSKRIIVYEEISDHNIDVSDNGTVSPLKVSDVLKSDQY